MGLSSFVGRSKIASLGELKGRVWKKKFLSNGGREVLIKVVAQSIPTYTMSYFWLPDGLYNDLNNMFSNFWWGQHDKKNRAHWICWSQLCLSKDDGGLGFRAYVCLIKLCCQNRVRGYFNNPILFFAVFIRLSIFLVVLLWRQS